MRVILDGPPPFGGIWENKADMHHVWAEWKRFESAGRQVDGRMIHPTHESGDLILFCPGCPGNGATFYEQGHADQIANSGYSQIILRHNGTILDGPYSDFMLNTEQFPKATTHHHDNWIGGAPSTIRDWLVEPQTVLESVGYNFSSIYVIGHSFGAMAALNSLATLHETGHKVLDKVKACLCLAPALGTLDGSESDNIMRLWVPQFLDGPLLRQKIALDDADSIRIDLRETYKYLAERTAELPAHIALSFLHVERDEYIHETDIRSFMAACKRGTFTLDKADHPHRAKDGGGIEAHDMPGYPTALLLQLIEGQGVLTDVTSNY